MPYSLSALRYHAKLIKEDLLQGGVDKVELLGLPDEEIRIEIREAELARLASLYLIFPKPFLAAQLMSQQVGLLMGLCGCVQLICVKQLLSTKI